MEEKKEKYITVLKRIYGAFNPGNIMPVKTKVALLLLSLLISFLIMIIKHLIVNALWK